MGVYNDMYKMGAMVIAMSDAMEILYAYAKEELLPSYLPSPAVSYTHLTLPTT